MICSSLVWHPISIEAYPLTLSKRDHYYFVYIVASRTHVLYCGMTNSIERRVEEHRQSAIPGFTEIY